MFIVVEGIDYSGKSTVVEQIGIILKQNNYEVCETREPGGFTLGERVREILVSEDANKPEDKDIWGILLAATRIEHGRHLIKPALKDGKVVISSRYIFSTSVYQPEAMKWIKDITEKHPDVVEPDFLIVCDVSTDTAKKRKSKRTEENPDDHDYMDDMWVPEWEKQRERFKAIARKNPEKSFVFSTEQPLSVQFENLKHLLRHIGFKIS